MKTLITCHTNADWDALSAIIGASLLYPDSTLVFPGSMEKELNKFFEDVINPLYKFTPIKEVEASEIELVVLVDTCQASRVPHIAHILKQDIQIHIWDHHPQENCLQAEEYHYQNYGSTCTLLTMTIKELGHTPNCQDATILGLGIYGDTGMLSHNSTTTADYLASAWLLEHGMNLDTISALVRYDLTSNHVKILNSLLDNAINHELGQYVLTVTQATMESFVGDFAHIVQRFMEMEACHVLFAIGIMDDKIQVVARSRIENINVGIVCKTLGGGGHHYAAAAAVKNLPLPEVKETIYQQIYAQTHSHRVAAELMSSPAIGIEDKQNMREAQITMNRYGLKAVPVYWPGTHQCVGFLDEQIAARAVSHGLGDMPVRVYMQRKPQVVSPNTPLQNLMDIIVGAKQRLVPVVDNNEVIGVVTRTDIINMFVEEQGRLPLPKSDNVREQRLGKLLQSRLPKFILNILQQAGQLGDELGICVYAVGGFVRDTILARPSAELDDVDLVVEGNGIDFAHKLAEKLNGRVRVHQTFLTAVIILYDGHGQEHKIDVATARLEYYLYPAALPTVELSSIKMDLFRRDFTINAMALRLNIEQFGNLVDFFGGQDDIQRKNIRVLHALSFVEDPTRIIRAVRFAQRYSFRLGGQCSRLIKNALELSMIGKLSGPRIMHELNLIFEEKNPLACIEQMDKLHILAAIHPLLKLNQAKHEVFSRLTMVLKWYHMLYMHEKINLQTLYLLAFSSGHTITDTQAILDRLCLSETQTQSFTRLREFIRSNLTTIANWQKNNGKISELCAILNQIPLEGALYLMARAPSEEASRNISLYINRWREIKADIQGRDLRNLNIPPGPLYGKILKQVWCDKLDGIVKTKEEQLELAKKLYLLEQQG